VRDVPSNQEVFVDENSDTSIIIELLSLVEEATNQDSATFHFNSLAHDNDARNSQILQVGEAPPDAVPSLGGNAYKSLLYGRQHVTKFRETAENVVDIYLCCLRLHDVQTDMVITLNSPVAVNPASSSSAATPQAEIHPALSQNIFAHFLRTLKINDWTLFG